MYPKCIFLYLIRTTFIQTEVCSVLLCVRVWLCAVSDEIVLVSIYSISTMPYAIWYKCDYVCVRRKFLFSPIFLRLPFSFYPSVCKKCPFCWLVSEKCTYAPANIACRSQENRFRLLHVRQYRPQNRHIDALSSSQKQTNRPQAIRMHALGVSATNNTGMLLPPRL